MRNLTTIQSIIHQLGYPEIKSREHNILVLNMLMGLTNSCIVPEDTELTDEEELLIKKLQEQICEVEGLDLDALIDLRYWNNL